MFSLTAVSAPRNKSLLIGLIWAAINLYTVFMAGYVVLHLLTGTRWWPVWLVSNFAHWLLLPLFLVLPLALWQRRWLVMALSTVGVLGFLLSYGALFLPSGSLANAAVEENTQSFTVMSYNIQNRRISPVKLLEIVDSVDADIIGIVELGAAQGSILEQSAYPYHVLYGTGASGVGLLSRYPIVEHERFRLTARRRPYLRAVLDVDGQLLTVVVAHPPSPDPLGFSYQPDPDTSNDLPVLADLAAAGHPAILLGDLNTNDQSDDYRHLIDAGLIDSFRSVGWGFGTTWPTPSLFGKIALPAFVRIDYIFHTPELRALTARPAFEIDNSDHLPVIAELQWVQSGD